MVTYFESDRPRTPPPQPWAHSHDSSSTWTEMTPTADVPTLSRWPLDWKITHEGSLFSCNYKPMRTKPNSPSN